MMEHMEGAPRERDAALHHVIKTDPDPRFRRRAQALLWVAEGHSQASAARLLETSAYRVHVWQQRFDAFGRAGLVDRPRGGRPHALSETDRALLAEALDRGPQASHEVCLTEQVLAETCHNTLQAVSKHVITWGPSSHQWLDRGETHA